MSKLNLKMSNHALNEHKDEAWNARTIVEAYLGDRLSNVELIEGKTADVLMGFVGDQCVGLIIGKQKGFWGPRTVITGFAAPKEYWEHQAK